MDSLPYVLTIILASVQAYDLVNQTGGVEWIKNFTGNEFLAKGLVVTGGLAFSTSTVAVIHSWIVPWAMVNPVLACVAGKGIIAGGAYKYYCDYSCKYEGKESYEIKANRSQNLRYAQEEICISIENKGEGSGTQIIDNTFANLDAFFTDIDVNSNEIDVTTN